VSYFRQMFDRDSRTYTYLIADIETGAAALIDPVLGEIGLYLGLLEERRLRLAWVLETHVHADHITAAAALRSCTGARVVFGRDSGAEGADLLVADGDDVPFGHETVRVIATPGHSAGCVSYLWRDRVFTGDSLLIRSCGRTDLPGGDAGQLFDSLMRKLLSLPDETLVYPGHDYQGRCVSCVGEERVNNPCVSGRTRDEFAALMGATRCPESPRVDLLMAANRRCGDVDGAHGRDDDLAYPSTTLHAGMATDAGGIEFVQCAAAPSPGPPGLDSACSWLGPSRPLEDTSCASQ
jgi:sulfur dioxygenase